MAFFTIDYLARAVCTPNRWRFFLSFMNTIDLVAIAPFYLELMIKGQSTGALRACLKCCRRSSQDTWAGWTAFLRGNTARPSRPAPPRPLRCDWLAEAFQTRIIRLLRLLRVVRILRALPR
jgi:hypothetical protein